MSLKELNIPELQNEMDVNLWYSMNNMSQGKYLWKIDIWKAPCTEGAPTVNQDLSGRPAIKAELGLEKRMKTNHLQC